MAVQEGFSQHPMFQEGNLQLFYVSQRMRADELSFEDKWIELTDNTRRKMLEKPGRVRIGGLIAVWFSSKSKKVSVD